MKTTKRKHLHKVKKISSKIKLSKWHKLARNIVLGTVIITALFSLCTVGFAALVGTKNTGIARLVTFRDRGEDHVILTDAVTVKGALEDANISIDPKDVVEPSIDSELFSTDSAVIIYRARLVLVVDGALRERVLTPAQSPNEIALAAKIDPVDNKDETSISRGNFVTEGASTILTIKRALPDPPPAPKIVFGPGPKALTKARGAQLYTDASGVAHRETYYDLPMNVVIGACGPGAYTVRYDGAKIDKDGYVLVAANYGVYPKCSVVDTSMGPGKVYDTGGFAKRYPHGFDLATDWTNYDGR